MATIKMRKIPTKKSPKTTTKKSREATTRTLVFVGTRKGAFVLSADSARRKWTLVGPHFLGCIVNHMVLDPRDRKTLLAACRTGHLGPTIYRSKNFGKTWQEAQLPPAFSKVPDGQKGRVVDHVFWLTPGHVSEKDVWYAGTSPQGLFRTSDGGMTWQAVGGFNDHPDYQKWVGTAQDMTPDGGKTHSINIDPTDAKHIYLGLSAGGFFESVDGGASWKRLNKGCDRVFADQDADDGHDPHCVLVHPAQPTRLYMQNHCGIYVLDRPSDIWQRVGRNMPKAIGDVGFPITVHPRDPNTAWVFPMDGREVWPRVSIDGKPAVYCTKNAGKTWKRQDKGLPAEQAWFTVKRQAMCADPRDPVGLYFGTTSGEVWMSRNEGEQWLCIANHLPHIYSVESAQV